MSAIVEVKGVHKRYRVPGAWPWSPWPEVHAVRGVDLTVGSGEVVALVGQSGSGKTTLARMVLGLESVTGAKSGSKASGGTPSRSPTGRPGGCTTSTFRRMRCRRSTRSRP